MRFFRQTLSPVNLILAPLKQHLGCCVVAPLLIKLAGATVLAETIVKNTRAEFLFLILLLPCSVWAILKLEDYWRARHERRHAHAHDACETHCHPPMSFKRRYITNLAVAFAIAFLMHHFFHHHDFAQ